MSELTGTLTFGIVIIFIVLGFGILLYDKSIPGFGGDKEQCSDNATSTYAEINHVHDDTSSSTEINNADSSDVSSTTGSSSGTNADDCPSTTLDRELNIPEDSSPKEVFNIQNNIFNYKEAHKVCQAYGAELATFEQVKDAYEDGANWCNYGWTKGQMALYPTQYSEWKRLQDSGVDEDLKKSCGRPGLNGGYFDNPNLKFGVNCYGVKDSATDEEIALSHRNSVGDVVDQLENDSASRQEEDTDVKKYRELRANGEISRNNFKCGSWNNHNVKSD